MSSSIVYSAISGKQTVNAFNGPANPEVAELTAKLMNQIDLSVDTKKSYSSKGYENRSIQRSFNDLTDIVAIAVTHLTMSRKDKQHFFVSPLTIFRDGFAFHF